MTTAWTLPEADVVDPSCRFAARVVDHRCTTRDGDPIRAGQSCWTEARTAMLDEPVVKAVNQAIAEMGVATPSDRPATERSGSATGHLRAVRPVPDARQSSSTGQGGPPVGLGPDRCDECGGAVTGDRFTITCRAGAIYEESVFCTRAHLCVWTRRHWMGGADARPRVYRHPNCGGGAHQSCPLPLACSCPCHLEQSARTAGRKAVGQ